MGNDTEDMLEISQGSNVRPNLMSSFPGEVDTIIPGSYSSNVHSSSSTCSSTSFSVTSTDAVNMHDSVDENFVLYNNNNSLTLNSKDNNTTPMSDVNNLNSNGSIANPNDGNNTVVGRLQNVIQDILYANGRKVDHFEGRNIEISENKASTLHNFNDKNMENSNVSGELLNNGRESIEGIDLNTTIIQAFLEFKRALSSILEKYNDIGKLNDGSDMVREGKVNVGLNNATHSRHCNIIRRLSASLDHLLTPGILNDQNTYGEQINKLTEFANVLSIEGQHNEELDSLSRIFKRILCYLDTTRDCSRRSLVNETIGMSGSHYNDFLTRNSSSTSTTTDISNHINVLQMDDSRRSILSSHGQNSIDHENSIDYGLLEANSTNDMDLDTSITNNNGTLNTENTENNNTNIIEEGQVNRQQSSENKDGEEDQEEEEPDIEGYCTDLSVHISEEGLKAMGLLCSICFNIPRDPVKTSKSHNLYCFSCLDKCYMDPADTSSRISKSDYNFDIGDRKNQIENMILKCPHAEKYGCPWSNPLQAWDVHVRDNCPYTKIPCSYCKVPFMRLNIENHINSQHRYLCKFCEEVSLHPAEELCHYEICPARPVTCPVCKHNGIKRTELHTHILTAHTVEDIVSSLLEQGEVYRDLTMKNEKTENELNALKEYNEKYTMNKGKIVYKVFKLSRGTKVCYEGEVIEVINLTGGVNVCFEDGKSMVVQKDYLLFSPPRGIITYKEYMANRANARNYL